MCGRSSDDGESATGGAGSCASKALPTIGSALAGAGLQPGRAGRAAGAGHVEAPAIFRVDDAVQHLIEALHGLGAGVAVGCGDALALVDRKSTRLTSSH